MADDPALDDMAVQPPDKIVIDVNSDLLLIAGSPKKPLLVSSKILTLISKVFATMLSPTFKEGSEVAEHSRLAISI
jgi:hypothetical protein